MKKRKIVDQEFAHTLGIYGFDSNCQVPTKTFVWDRTTDYKPNELVIFTTRCIPSALSINGIRKIAWLTEPRSLYPHIYEGLTQCSHLFHKVVTSNKDFVSQLTNGVYVPIASTWIDERDWGVHDKKEDVSIIYSSKVLLPGHKLRHEVAAKYPEVHRYGSGSGNNKLSGPLESKAMALKDYRFSIVIENERTNGYFTEKLIDSLVLGTIPIYWGDPQIGETFDKKGILSFNSMEELDVIMNSNLEEYYNLNLPSVIANQKMSRNFQSADEVLMSHLGNLYD
jgi:hypothetical protein